MIIIHFVFRKSVIWENQNNQFNFLKTIILKIRIINYYDDDYEDLKLKINKYNL